LISITFGSNRFIGTNGIITFRDDGKDKDLFKYELRSSDSKPLIDVEIRDNNGELLGKVWKSTSFVHCHKDYEGKEEREGSDIKRMALIRKKDNTTVFELIVHKPTDIEVNGIFHIEGYQYPIIATKDGLKIGGILFAHNTKISRGKGIILTRNDFMI
jgi:hypothetical protein